MKVLPRVLTVTVLLGLLISPLVMPDQPVWATAGTQVPDPGALLEVNPDAEGFTVLGTLSIFYVDNFGITICELPGDFPVDMHVAIRASTDTSGLRSEGEIFREVCYFDFLAHQVLVKDLIGTQLLAKLFPDGFISFEVQEVTDLVQDEAGTGLEDTDPLFMITDFALKVLTQDFVPPEDPTKRELRKAIKEQIKELEQQLHQLSKKHHKGRHHDDDRDDDDRDDDDKKRRGNRDKNDD